MCLVLSKLNKFKELRGKPASDNLVAHRTFNPIRNPIGLTTQRLANWDDIAQGKNMISPSQSPWKPRPP
jgi:hypothetical protein